MSHYGLVLAGGGGVAGETAPLGTHDADRFGQTEVPMDQVNGMGLQIQQTTAGFFPVGKPVIVPGA